MQWHVGDGRKNPIRRFFNHQLRWSDLALTLRSLRVYWLHIALLIAIGFLAFELLPLLGHVPNFFGDQPSPTETPVPGDLPGFFHCSYPTAGEKNPLTYDLYIPPHFQEEQGPFPLITFLAGYGERNGNLKIGLAPFIRQHVKDGGRFEFVAFFPTQIGLSKGPRTIEMLDYVIKKHRIDPDRITLTGHSQGGSRVWKLASEYPDRWAAIAPVCAPGQPNIERIAHLPCWLFQGGADGLPLPETARATVQRLRNAGGEVRYTEYPGEGHLIWPKVYATAELYSWFAEKRRR